LEGENLNEDQVMEAAIEAGAEDVQFDDGSAQVYTSMEDLWDVHQGLTEAGLNPAEAQLTRIPQNTIALDGKQAETMLKLMEMLEDNDDVQNVYANFDIPDEVFEKMAV
jgi:transcriptional/translational regulatory protein YebC/TACO1